MSYRGWSEGVVDRHSPVPAYHQLAQVLRMRIQRGDWGVGEQLPTEIQLSSEYDVSRSTVRQALSELAENLVVSREHGKGTFVLAATRLLMNDLSLPMGLAHRARSQGVDLQAKVLSISAIDDVPDEVRQRLQLGAGDEVIELRRMMTLDSAPAALVLSWLPAGRVPGLLKDGLVDGSISHTLVTRYGVELGRYDNQLEVAGATQEQAELLGVEMNDPLILLSALCLSVDEVPLEDSQTYWRADRVRLRFGVTPPRSSA